MKYKSNDFKSTRKSKRVFGDSYLCFNYERTSIMLHIVILLNDISKEERENLEYDHFIGFQ
jgi:hypothetical protein